MTNDELKKKIMRRVYTIYVLRKVFNPLMYRLYLLVALLGGVASFVSISNVVANMPRYGISNLYDFSMYAFLHTEVTVQVLTLGAGAVLLWFILDLTRKIIDEVRVVAA